MESIISIIPVLLLIVGLGIIFNLLRVYIFYSYTIKKWNCTIGKILKSEVTYFRSKIDSDTEGWKENIVYSYMVNGVKYESNTLTKNIGHLSHSKEWVERTKRKLMVDNEILVYYNPKKHNESLIDNKFNYKSLLLIIISLIAFFTALYIK